LEQAALMQVNVFGIAFCVRFCRDERDGTICDNSLSARHGSHEDSPLASGRAQFRLRKRKDGAK
jgi:hypothetical protein